MPYRFGEYWRININNHYVEFESEEAAWEYWKELMLNQFTED